MSYFFGLGKIWKGLNEEDRAVYEKKANDDKERYNEVGALNVATFNPS